MRGSLRVDDNRPGNAGITTQNQREPSTNDGLDVALESGEGLSWPGALRRHGKKGRDRKGQGAPGEDQGAPGEDQGAPGGDQEPRERTGAWARPAGPSVSWRDSDPRDLSGSSFLLHKNRRSKVTSDITARSPIQGPLHLHSPYFHPGPRHLCFPPSTTVIHREQAGPSGCAGPGQVCALSVGVGPVCPGTRWAFLRRRWLGAMSPHCLRTRGCGRGAGCQPGHPASGHWAASPQLRLGHSVKWREPHQRPWARVCVRCPPSDPSRTN